MTAPRPNRIRHRVDPGDVPADKAARRLHLTLEEFRAKLPELLERGFPPADPTTGMFDLDEINRWRKGRHHPQDALTAVATVGEPSLTVSLGDKFRETKERKRHDRAA